MKKRLVLKPIIIPVIYTIAVLILVMSFYFTTKALKQIEDNQNLQFVSDTIFDDILPVINLGTKIANPYLDESVKIGKYFYDYSDPEERKKESLVFYKNTYMPNTGVDYVSETIFDVVSILDGTVITVKEDELLGKIVEIRHSNELISVYQSLSETNVKTGDIVAQGQVIGKSGSSVISQDLKNHLHFEIYHNGQIVNPLNYIGKKLNEI